MTRQSDFHMAIKIAKVLRNVTENPNEISHNTSESVDSLIVELRFLYTFLAYARMWSNASHKNKAVVPNLDSVLTKVGAAAKAFRKCLNNAYIDKNSSYGHGFPCCGSKSSDLLHVFTRLNEKIDFLKLEIREVYDCLSTHSFHSHPSSPFSKSSGWDIFCKYLGLNLEFLPKKSNFGGPLRKQMEGFKENLSSLKGFLEALYSDRYHYSDPYPWNVDMMSHFGKVVMRTAHVCCLCWCANVDQNMEKDLSILLSDLQHKIDLASPEFLEMILGLPEKDEFQFYRLESAFVDNMLGLGQKTVFRKELKSLVSYVNEISKMRNMDMHRFSVDIKDLIKEARYLRNKDYRTYKTDLITLLAKIWFLKAEIFIKDSSSLVMPSSIKYNIDAIHEGSTFLRTYFTKADYVIVKLVKELPRQLESLHQSSHAEDSVGKKVRDVLYKFLVQILLFQADKVLFNLLNNDESMLLPLKHLIGTLREGVIFIIESDINEPKENTEDEKLILTYIEALATGVISLCNSFPVDNVTEEAVKSLEVWLSDLLEMVQLLKSKLKDLYLHIHFQVSRLNFPKTPGLWFIDFLLQNLRWLLIRNYPKVAYAAYQIEAIQRDLEFIISRFGHVVEQDTENQECKNLHTRFVNVAYEAEYVIDSMVAGKLVKSQHLLWLYHLSEEIRHIKIQVTNVFSKNTFGVGVHNVHQKLNPIESHVSPSSVEEVMVGLNDQKEVIIDQLTRGTLQRDVVSIVGMPGIGKTTLANNLFSSPTITYHFHIRAWCHVSQRYRKRDLLLYILRDIIRPTDNILAMSDEDLELVLYKHLKKKKYLIVMDDMWSIEAWNDLQSSFPDDSNGSRILMTSRLHGVVSKVSDPHPLRLLSDDESWELLKIKIFRNDGCPEELLEVGIQIAKNCEGLPLSIGAVAGLLERTNKNQECWIQIAKSVSSLIVNDPQTKCMDILELSYQHLPDCLKACFLYFGAISNDKYIPVRRLLWLWIAEGFIQKLECKSLEDLAEDNLMDLVGRNLVIVAKRRSNGKVKACRVHDMVFNLCLLKAKDENFVRQISSNDEPYSSFDGLDYGVHYELLNPSNSIAYKEHRLSFFVNRELFVASRPSGLYLRSLLFFATTDTYPRCPYDVSFISKNFKLLRVLDLESINIGHSFANGIESLVHLRHLAISGDMDSIPPSLSNLQNLETLIVKGLKSKVVLPDTLWCMTKLRHVHVTSHAIFTLQNEENGSYSKLDSLVSLSLPSFSSVEETKNIIMKFPNLQKLRCIFLGSSDVSENFCQFPGLESLCQLESLRVSYYGRALNSTGEFNLPSSLKKLTLANFRLPWDHISAIGRLQNLEVLKLISRAFEGSSWDMKEGEFLKLKYLKLDTLNFVHWDASSDHLPQLQQLVVRNCKQLEEVPFGFVDIPALQKIEIQQCGSSAEESVRRIEEEGVDGLRILIISSHSD